MRELIDKAVVAAEIKRRINGLKDCHADRIAGYAGEISGLKRLLSFIDTLEVKEVDLEKEIKEAQHNYKVDNNQHTSICAADIEWIAEHFFELGLKAKGG